MSLSKVIIHLFQIFLFIFKWIFSEQLNFSSLQTTYFTIKVFYWSLPFVSTNDWCPSHPMWCLIGCYVCGVKWLVLFSSSFFKKPSLSISFTTMKAKTWMSVTSHKIQKMLLDFWSLQKKKKSTKSSFVWLNGSSKSRQTRMFSSPRLPIYV